MSKIFDLYGSLTSDVSEVKHRVEQALKLALFLRDSSFHGTYFCSDAAYSSEQYLLKGNIDPLDGEPVEADYPEYKTLLYVNDPKNWDIVKERLTAPEAGMVHLRHEVL